MTDTQCRTSVPMDERARRACGTAQWVLEKSEDKNTPPFHFNNLALFICGEEAFAKIAEDLKRAKSSVEIICWGFDPAMELIREKTVWPRGDTWGGLLKEVAEGKYNGGNPVQVRLLSWYGFIGNLGTNNMPGYGRRAVYDLSHTNSSLWGGNVGLDGSENLVSTPVPVDPKDQREVFNAHWYKDASEGRMKNLVLRTRDGDIPAVLRSLGEESGKRGFIETAGMAAIATDHQKTILIDYEHEGGADAVGYVMGLNSVTDYWDTQQHLFHDPRRGEGWEGANDTQPGLKPYQDYACRIRGEALVAVSKNFSDAWNRAKGKGDKLARTHDVRKPPPGLAKNLEDRTQRAMIVRTQPEEDDKSIKRVYRQASSFARHYLYVENQYFQHTEWAQQLKADRQAFANGWQAKGKNLADLPKLHVMVVIPTPEKAAMVPRTYDTVKSLGQGTSMPNQDKQIEDEIRRHDLQQAECDRFKQHAGPHDMPPTPPLELSAPAQSAKALGTRGNIARELDAIGLRTLVASLWTFDRDWRASQGKELAVAKALEGNPVHAQRYKGTTDKLRAARYREIYIHSKLLLIDDSMFTLGSANLNLRSMATDAEINVASDDEGCCADLRRRVWALHTGGAEGCNPSILDRKTMFDAFDAWRHLMFTNAKNKSLGNPPTGFLFPFHDERTSRMRLG